MELLTSYSFIGPTWPVENGSVMGPLQTVGQYAIQIIKKMQKENVKSWSPRQDVTDSFNEHAQEWIKYTVWKDDCRSWYKNNETGRVNGTFTVPCIGAYLDTDEKQRYGLGHRRTTWRWSRRRDTKTLKCLTTIRTPGLIWAWAGLCGRNSESKK